MIYISIENINRINFTNKLIKFFGLHTCKYHFICKDYACYLYFKSKGFTSSLIKLERNLIYNDNFSNNLTVSDRLHYDLNPRMQMKIFNAYKSFFQKIEFTDDDLIICNNGYSFFDIAIRQIPSATNKKVFLENINILGYTFCDTKGSNNQSKFFELKTLHSKNIKKSKYLISNNTLEIEMYEFQYSFFYKIKNIIFDFIFNTPNSKLLMKRKINYRINEEIDFCNSYKLSEDDALVFLQVETDTQLNYNTNISSPMKYIVEKALIENTGIVYVKPHPKCMTTQFIVSLLQNPRIKLVNVIPIEASELSNIYIFNSSIICKLPKLLDCCNVINIEDSLHSWLRDNEQYGSLAYFKNTSCIPINFN